MSLSLARRSVETFTDMATACNNIMGLLLLHRAQLPLEEDLKGPAAGKVELPLHVAWSGRRVYDVEDSSQRLALYALLLAEAQREDLERFLHRESLVSMWPRLRRLLGPHARRAWERQLLAAAPR